MIAPSGPEAGHVPVASFEEKYRAEADPWRFATSEYEQRRYELTVALLPAARYRKAFEPGCAIGELTMRLARRCDHVLAIDSSPTVVARARARCQRFSNVTIEVGELPQDWPPGHFDLVVLSEIGYYFPPREWILVLERSAAALVPGGALVAVHWRGHSEDHVLHGDEVHAIAQSAAEHGCLCLAAQHVEDAFRADVWTKGAV